VFFPLPPQNAFPYSPKERGWGSLRGKGEEKGLRRLAPLGGRAGPALTVTRLGVVLFLWPAPATRRTALLAEGCLVSNIFQGSCIINVVDSATLTQIAQIVGISSGVLSPVITGYIAFKKSNVEKFFEMLLKDGKTLNLESDKNLQNLFFSIMDKVSTEANEEKIRRWKNAVIHLATDFKDFDYKDNFLRTLEDLTPFDMTVLHYVCSREFSRESLTKEVVQYFQEKSAPVGIVNQSLKRLASHDLITEKFDRTAFTSTGEALLSPLIYEKSSTGSEFMRFIQDEFSDS